MLAQCPVGPALRMDQHLDELIRELQLLDAEVAARELDRGAEPELSALDLGAVGTWRVSAG